MSVTFKSGTNMRRTRLLGIFSSSHVPCLSLGLLISHPFLHWTTYLDDIRLEIFPTLSEYFYDTWVLFFRWRNIFQIWINGWFFFFLKSWCEIWLVYLWICSLRYGFLSYWISLRNIGKDLRETQVEYVTTKFFNNKQRFWSLKWDTDCKFLKMRYRLKTVLFSSAHFCPKIGWIERVIWISHFTTNLGGHFLGY